MADYAFYTGTYLGDSIPESEFARLAKRAGDTLSRYKRIYSISLTTTDSEDMALCAMADAYFYFENAQSESQSSSIGSVSSSRGALDVSPKAQQRELYRCACQYLNVYRGAKVCSV